jgi:flagellar motor switch protein FliG
MMKMSDKRLGAYNKIVKGTAAKGNGNTDDAVVVADKASGGQKKTVHSDISRGKQAIPERQSTARESVKLPGLIKVPGENGTGPDGKESPYRKVAKFLLLVGVDEAAKVMSRLTPEQTERVVLEIASIRRVDPDEAAIVLAEFESLLQRGSSPSGGIDTARSILESAFGPERAAQMLEKAIPDVNGRPFDYLDDMDGERLLALIVDELPAVKALVLSRIKPATAASAIKHMTATDRSDTVIRLARLKAINPEVLRRVDDAMREKVRNMNVSSADSIDGRSALAEILRRMDGAGEKSILDRLSDDDPELGHDLRNRLFTIDDIVRADDKFLQEALRSMSERDIAVLVSGKSEAFRQKIFENISRTRGVIVLEEERLAQPVNRAEAEKITGGFFIVMRRAWEEGKVLIDGRDDKEVWV